VVRVRDFGGHVADLRDENPGVMWDGPLVVLTSRLTASASEILAGAIQDYRRGLVVGDPKTHGKGTVQTVLPLDGRRDGQDLGAMKVTIQQFYRPSGLSTQRQGVIPDLVLPSVTSDLETGEELLDQALAANRVGSCRFVPYAAGIDDVTLKRIEEASRTRRAASDYFKRLDSSQGLARRQKEAGKVPLQQEAFRALRAELEAASLREPDLPTEGRNSVVKDGYLDEVLLIAADWSQQAANGDGRPGRTRE
jgi:carboxyl-terminal processing protease